VNDTKNNDEIYNEAQLLAIKLSDLFIEWQTPVSVGQIACLNVFLMTAAGEERTLQSIFHLIRRRYPLIQRALANADAAGLFNRH
jgi:hypothetical protein